MQQAGIAAVALVALIATGCAAAAAENQADNIEAENVVILAGQLGSDWSAMKNAPDVDKEQAITVAASAEAAKCLRPRPDVSAIASGDWMSNSTVGGIMFNQTVYHRSAVDADGLAGQLADPAVMECYRKISLPAFEDSASGNGVTVTDAAVSPVLVAAPEGTKAVGLRYTATLHQPDGSTLAIREDQTSVFVGRAEAMVMVGGPADAFPEDSAKFAIGMVGGRLIKADTK